MVETIHEKIDVVTVYRYNPTVVFPHKIRWRGREYKIQKVGYHHREKVGKTMYHIFHVASSSIAFRLRHDPNYLDWTLEEVSDDGATI